MAWMQWSDGLQDEGAGWPGERAWSTDLEAGAATCVALSRLAERLPSRALLRAGGQAGEVLTLWVVGSNGCSQTLYDFTRAHRQMRSWQGDVFDPLECEPHSGTMSGYELIDPFALMDLGALACAHWARLMRAAPERVARAAKQPATPWSCCPCELALCLGWPECAAWMEREGIVQALSSEDLGAVVESLRL